MITITEVEEYLWSFYPRERVLYGACEEITEGANARHLDIADVRNAVRSYRASNKKSEYAVPSWRILSAMLPKKGFTKNEYKLHGHTIPEQGVEITDDLVIYLDEKDRGVVHQKGLHFAMCYCWSKANYRAYVEFFAQVPTTYGSEIDRYRAWAAQEHLDKLARFEKYRNQFNPKPETVTHSKADQELIDRIASTKKFGKTEPKRMEFYQ